MAENSQEFFRNIGAVDLILLVRRWHSSRISVMSDNYVVYKRRNKKTTHFVSKVEREMAKCICCLIYVYRLDFEVFDKQLKSLF